MCGRITLTTPDVEAVARMLDAQVTPEAARIYRPRYNAAPTDTHVVMNAQRLLVPAVWGFASGQINARSEKQRRGERIIVAADGFYEWTGPAKARQPVWFRPRDGGLLYLAGLAEPLPDGRLGFVVLTTDAQGLVARIHDRMPVMLPRAQVQAWLDRGDALLIAPDELKALPVSQRVNDVRNDDPSVLQPPSQLSLL